MNITEKIQIEVLSSNFEITKDNLKELDKKVVLIPITFDPIFKSVFGRNINLLKKFLNDVLFLELDIDGMDIKLLNTELPIENIGEYRKRIDIFIKINNNIYIDVEINRSNFERVKLRNYLYGSKIYSMLLESGHNIAELEDKFFIQLNLNTKERSRNFGREEISLYNMTKNEVYIKQEKIVLEYLEYYKKLYYTDKNELDVAGYWLAGLASDNFVELFDILSNILDKKELTKFIEDVIKMSLEDFNIHEWEKDKLDELVRYNYYKDGKLEGKIEGEVETRENIVKEMLQDNVDIKLISKYTGKSEEEIKKIEESMKVE